MNKVAVKIIVLVSLLAGSLILVSCTGGGLTTVTVTTGSNAPTATQTITITKTPGATTTTGTPSATPHSLEIELGQCFLCHSVPPGHEGRMLIESVCWSCHQEAPIDEWKVGSWH